MFTFQRLVIFHFLPFLSILRIPYNPWLLRQLDYHINVEICTSVKSIKYVLKYVHKRNDQATFQIQNDTKYDEIKNFVNARYTGSTEAA